MEFKILILERKKNDDKMCLCDLEDYRYNFKEIPNIYDIIFVNIRDEKKITSQTLSYAILNLKYNFTLRKKHHNPNYKFMGKEFNTSVFFNVKSNKYSFYSIISYTEGSVILSEIRDNIDPFIAVYEYLFDEKMNDTQLCEEVNRIKNKLPIIAISQVNLMQNHFLHSLFEITEISSFDEGHSCYLIKKKRKPVIKAAIKKTEIK